MLKDSGEIALKKYKKIFKLIACSISGNDIIILESNDEIGSYYENNIILPKKMVNKKCYIYKILFSIISMELNLYIKSNRENIDYKLITSLITIKTINKKLINSYNNVKNIIKELYPLTNKKRAHIKDLKERYLLIEIIIKKFTYEKIKETFFLTNAEKEWIFKVENTINIEEKKLMECTNNLYNLLIKLHTNYAEPIFYLLWGYIYAKNDVHLTKIFKHTIKNKIIKQKKSKTILIINKINNIKKQNNIQPVFDYKKTHDKYNNNNKNTDKSTSISENFNKNSSANSNHSISLLIKSNVIKKITINTSENTSSNKKITYKEWDYIKNTYKQNWCHLFIKNLYSTNEKSFNINENIKNEIKLFKKYFKLILNKTKINKKKTNGYEIDIDSVVDNYKEIVNNTYNKVYIQKNKKNKDTAIIILIDSSLSTESFCYETQTLEKLKNIAYIISDVLNNSNTKFMVTTFHSNTRYDCRYLIIKNLNEKWNIKKNTLLNINPTGYTRIGPAIRHSINILKNIKAEKRIIILLSDGTPTDYDTYEGLYGLNDIKKSITEAKKQKIYIKTILVNNGNNDFLLKILQKKNCYQIKNKEKIYTKLIKLFNSI